MEEKMQITTVVDLDSLKTKGEIVALVDNSSTSYFLYRGEPMGFEYELISKFADHLELDLKVKVVDNLDQIIDQLNSNEGDIIAANLTVTKARTEVVQFTDELLHSKQVLVQRRYEPKDTASNFIHSITDLIGKKVSVRKNSSFYERIQNLSDEIGGEIIIDTAAGEVTVEQLISKVSSGEINYTISDEHVARINKAFYQNIDLDIPISLDQQVAWAVRIGSDSLLHEVNAWLSNYKKTKEYRVLYLKYFGNTVLYRNRIKSDYFTSKSGRISPYDDLIKELSLDIHWDWQLISALIYQESQFDHHAKSWAGAIGIMQLMPATAKEFNVDSSSSPEENMRAGIKYIKWLDKQFMEKVPDSLERRKFILGAYNVGLGHIYDAIRLAGKYELNPQLWDNNTAEMLLMKSKPEYYRDEVSYYGYCRGIEPYQYVKRIFDRFEHYKNITTLKSN